MKRLFATMLLTAATAAALCSCATGRGGGAGSSLMQGSRAGTGSVVGTGSASGEHQREIVCWGDSMTQGVGASRAIIVNDDGVFYASYLSYPEILEKLTGITTYNFGVSGSTSEEIAYMQGALSEGELQGELSIISGDVMRQARSHPGDVLVLEIGSNGGWDGDYSELIRQCRAMIEHAGCEDYIIVGDTDDPGTSADPSQGPFGWDSGTGETAWEAALREEFGAHFVNMRAYLVERGLEVAGLNPTWGDAGAASRGRISEQLRADWTHLNSYGYYAQAMAVYEKGRELGYW